MNHNCEELIFGLDQNTPAQEIVSRTNQMKKSDGIVAMEKIKGDAAQQVVNIIDLLASWHCAVPRTASPD